MPAPRPAPVVPLHRPGSLAAPMDERDDEALMLLAAGDHRAAFEVLARRHLDPLTRYCAKFVGSARAGEELVQEALLEAWARRRAYRPGRFRVFLFTIARSRCLNRLRDERRRPTPLPVDADDEPVDPADDRPDQLDALLERERRRRTREALLELAPKLREAILLRYDQGLEYAEIARIVGRPEVTVRSRVFHALKKLRDALSEEDGR